MATQATQSKASVVFCAVVILFIGVMIGSRWPVRTIFDMPGGDTVTGKDMVCVPRLLDSDVFTEGQHELAYISEEDKACLRHQNGYGGQYIFDASQGKLVLDNDPTNLPDYFGSDTEPSRRAGTETQS